MLWFWGLGGAFMYAGPLLSAELAESIGKEEKPPRWPFFVKFIVALVVGAVAAEAFTSMASSTFNLSIEGHALRGVAAIVGYGANKFDLQKLIEKFMPGKQD